MYTYIYVFLDSWKYIFWIQNIIATTCGVSYIVLLHNSPRTYFSKNVPDQAINILKKIASFNGKKNEFEEGLNDKEFDSLLKRGQNEQEEIKEEMHEDKNKLGYFALIKYLNGLKLKIWN